MAPTSIICSGDVILDAEQPDHWLSGIAACLCEADITIGHLEVPHTYATFEDTSDVPAPGADPEHIAALQRAGFTAMTLAGNHIMDCGEQGIADTLAGLDASGIAHCGAGANLALARRPLVLECKERRVGVLSYNCVGPESCWAALNKPGCAFLPVATGDGAAVSPQRELLSPEPEALAILKEDIEALCAQVELVIVALHKGIVHTPAVIAPYERVLAHTAIDAGADVVIGHHAHIIRGIEFYHGKPVFHGLGNGCVVTHALDPRQNHTARAQWARRRKQQYGFEPDPDYFLAPFHPEAVNSFLARLLWHEDGRLEAGILPVHVEAPGRPRAADAGEAARICSYLQDITREAGLPALVLTPRNDMVSL